MKNNSFLVRASYNKNGQEEQREQKEGLLHGKLLGKLEGGDSLSDKERESLESLERRNKFDEL